MNGAREAGVNGARVALYARVSTLHGQNPEMQLAELREYALRRGWTVSREYVDIGFSGSKESRPEFNRMMKDAHGRAFDAIACWKLDRMGRSLKHLVNVLADLQALSVDFISLRDNLDLTTPSGRLMFHVIAAMAEFERALIRERVSAGIRAAKARGKRIGRPPVYADGQAVRKLRSEGVPWSQVSKRLGIGVGTAVRALQQADRVA